MTEEITLPEAEARIAQLEHENAELQDSLRRVSADLSEILNQIERLDLETWAEMKYAVDNDLPVTAPDYSRRELPITMIDDESWIGEGGRHIATAVLIVLLGLSLFSAGALVFGLRL